MFFDKYTIYGWGAVDSVHERCNTANSMQNTQKQFSMENPHKIQYRNGFDANGIRRGLPLSSSCACVCIPRFVAKNWWSSCRSRCRHRRFDSYYARNGMAVCCCCCVVCHQNIAKNSSMQTFRSDIYLYARHCCQNVTSKINALQMACYITPSHKSNHRNCEGK